MRRWSPRLALAALSVALCASGCVTPEQLNKRLVDFDETLKKRESRKTMEADAEEKELEARVASLEGASRKAETTLKLARDDIREVREKMELALETAGRMQTLQEEVRQALDAVRSIESRLNRRVGDTVAKYKDVLLEEKRVLMERLRGINESLRSLGDGTKEKGGGD